MRAPWAGSRVAAKRKKERMAARRALRARALFPLSFSRWSRKAATNGASTSSRSRSEGDLPRRVSAKRRRRQKASR